MKFVNADCQKIVIENPVGIMSTEYKKPSQIIQPYYFGDEAKKTTCLWLKGVSPLQHYKEDTFFHKKTHVSEGEFFIYPDGRRDPMWHVESMSIPPGPERSKARSKTFPGIASAMAEQWGAPCGPTKK